MAKGSPYLKKATGVAKASVAADRRKRGLGRSIDFGKGVDGTSDAQLLYIPGPASDNPLPLTVKYHVIVRDAGEASGYRTITSNPTVNLSVGFSPGQTTTIHLHLTVAE